MSQAAGATMRLLWLTLKLLLCGQHSKHKANTQTHIIVHLMQIARQLNICRLHAHRIDVFIFAWIISGRPIECSSRSECKRRMSPFTCNRIQNHTSACAHRHCHITVHKYEWEPSHTLGKHNIYVSNSYQNITSHCVFVWSRRPTSLPWPIPSVHSQGFKYLVTRARAHYSTHTYTHKKQPQHEGKTQMECLCIRARTNPPRAHGWIGGGSDANTRPSWHDNKREINEPGACAYLKHSLTIRPVWKLSSSFVFLACIRVALQQFGTRPCSRGPQCTSRGRLHRVSGAALMPYTRHWRTRSATRPI